MLPDGLLWGRGKREGCGLSALPFDRAFIYMPFSLVRDEFARVNFAGLHYYYSFHQST